MTPRRSKSAEHQHDRIIFSLAAMTLFWFLSPSAEILSRTTVLVLGFDNKCAVNWYGAGFVVKTDAESDFAYVLTALHVVQSANRINILLDPSYFPRDYAYELHEGIIPTAICEYLIEEGHPPPTEIQDRRIDVVDDFNQNSLDFGPDTMILSGGGREYLVQMRPEHLVMYLTYEAVLLQKSTPDMDIALLGVRGFPWLDHENVLYLAADDTVSPGARLNTFGCPRDVYGGFAAATARGTAVSMDSDFLLYESSLVSPGFSGGPVLVGGDVLAMNMTEDLRTGARIRARRASSFKPIIDDWIGLPRMRIDLSIQSPDGALDGTVSTGQAFAVGAAARLDPAGQILAPASALQLSLPEGFQTDDSLHGTLRIGDERRWRITAPHEATEPSTVALLASNTPRSEKQIHLAELDIQTEQAAHVRGSWTDTPRDGGTVFIGNRIPIALRFEHSGAPIIGFEGEASLQVSPYQFQIIEGRQGAAIKLGEDMRWNVEARRTASRARLEPEVLLRSVDKNGKPVQIDLPRPIHIGIKEDPALRFYLGIGRLDLNDPAAQSKLELETGFQIRVGNVGQWGIPLRWILAAGFGVDDTWLKEFELYSDSSFIMDYRYWFGTGLSIGVGPIGIGLESGYIALKRFVDDNIPQDIAMAYQRTPVRGLFFRPGLELNLTSMFAIYTGFRSIRDTKSNEYYLQLRFRRG